MLCVANDDWMRVTVACMPKPTITGRILLEREGAVEGRQKPETPSIRVLSCIGLFLFVSSPGLSA